MFARKYWTEGYCVEHSAQLPTLLVNGANVRMAPFQREMWDLARNIGIDHLLPAKAALQAVLVT